MKINNNTFNIGDKFRGIIDNTIFTIIDIVHHEAIGTKYHKDNCVYITFKNNKNENVSTTNLGNAKRLLLERI